MTIPFNNLAPALAEIRSDIDAAVKRVVDSGVFLNGPEVEAFEDEWARYCKVPSCIACASGTDALKIIADRMDQRYRSEVQANTCWYSRLGLDASTRDVDDRGNPLRLLADQFGMKLVPVLLYGRFIEPHNENGFRVVDACQGHGWKPGTSDIAAWSFYPTKNLGCFGDGGAITLNNERLYHRIQYDLTDSRPVRHSRMSELNAAVLRTKLPHLDRWNAERQKIAEVYYNELPDWRDGNFEPVCRPGEPTNHHIFAVLVDRRDELEKHMLENGCGVKVHYREPLAELPGAKRWCSRVLSLPCWPGLTAMQVQEVCDTIRSFK